MKKARGKKATVMKKNKNKQVGLSKAKTKKLPLDTASESGLRHHFQTFGEQMRVLKVPKINLHTLDVDASLNADEADLTQSCFGAAIDKWRELNLSQGFVQLVKRVAPMARSLGHVVHNQQLLADILQGAAKVDHAVTAQNLHLEPLLALWSALATDLQGDFLPHWPCFMTLCTEGMALQEPEVIKRGFEALTEVTKVLQRGHPKKANEVLMGVCEELDKYPLISEQSLALIAEALSRIIRRSATDKQLLVRALIQRVSAEGKAEEKRMEFVVEILVCASKVNALVKNQKGNLDQKVFAVLLDEAWKQREVLEATRFWRVLFATLKDTFGVNVKCGQLTVNLLREHGADSHSLTLLITELVADLCTCTDQREKVAPDFFLEWLTTFVSGLGSEDETHLEAAKKILQPVFASVDSKNREKKAKLGEIVDGILAESQFTLADKSEIICSLRDVWSFDTSDSVCFSRLLDFWQANYDTACLPAVAKSLRAICEQNAEDQRQLFSREASSNQLWQNFYVLEIPLISTTNTLPSLMAQGLEETLNTLEPDAVTDLLVCLAHVRPVALDTFTKACAAVQRRIIALVDSEEEEKVTPWILPLIRAMSTLLCPNDIFQHLNKSLLRMVGGRCAQDESILESVALLSTLDTTGQKLFGLIPDLETSLVNNLSSASARARLLSISALAHMKKVGLFQTMLKVESVEATMATFRDRVRLMGEIKATGNVSLDEAGLRFLVGNLFVNFSLLWKPVMELMETFVYDMSQELFWDVMESVYLASPEEEFPRKQILTALESMSMTCEIRCRFIVNDFLDVVMKGDEGKRRKITETFFKVFVKFQNLRSTKRFDELLAVAFAQLGEAESSSQLSGINFVCEAFKEVKQQKELLTQLADRQKWKDNLRTLAEKFADKGLTDKVQDAIKRLLVGHFKRTIRDKTQRQMHTRRFLVDMCAQIGETFLEGVLSAALEDSAPKVTPLQENKSGAARGTFERHENYEMCVDLCVMALPNIKRSKDQLMASIVEIMCLLTESYTERGGAGSKTRSKVLNLLARVFNTSCKHLEFTAQQEQQFLSACLLPALSRDTNESSAQVSSKLLVVFDSWLKTDRFLRLFFVKAENNCSVMDKLSLLLNSPHLDKVFLSDLVDRMCSLLDLVHNVIPSSNEGSIQTKDFDSTAIHIPLFNRLLEWMNTKQPLRGKVMVDERLASLSHILHVERDKSLTAAQVKTCIEALSLLPTIKTSEDVLSRWFEVLKAAMEEAEEIPDRAFRMLGRVRDHVFSKKVALLLAQFTTLKVENADQALDPYLLVSTYEHSTKNFLYILHCCFGQMNGTDLGQVTPALNAMLWLMEKLKTSMPDDFGFLCQQHLLKSVQRGLKNKDENSYSSHVAIFQYILKTEMIESLRDLSALSNVEEEETDFFDNMKHLQVHRRARALRNLSKRLDAGTVTVSKSSLTKYVQPLITRCFFNTDFKTSSDLLAACISCIASLCAALSLPGYIKLLEEFIRTDVSEEKAFAKQKFQIVAQILQNFHFDPDKEKNEDEEDDDDDDDEMLDYKEKKKREKAEARKEAAEERAIIEGAREKPAQELPKAHLRLKSIVWKLLQSMKGDASEGNLHVFVALAKIATVFPKLFKDLTQSLVIEVCNKLRARDFEFRQACRKTLAEMLNIFGPSYMFFILSTLETALTRGYQLHICVYTISYITHAIKDRLDADAVAAVLPKITEYVCKELFSDFAKEKKVKEITKKTPEAAKISSYSLVSMLASRCGKKSLKDIVLPFLNPSVGSLTHEKVQKCRQSLHNILMGLIDNPGLTRQDLFLFAFGVLRGKVTGDATNKTPLRPGLLTLRKEFALSLMLATVKKDQTFTLSEMKPLLKEVVSCLEAKSLDISLLCFKLLTVLMQHKDIMEHLNEEKMSAAVFKFIHGNIRRYFAMKDKQNFSSACVVLNKLLKHSDDTIAGDGKEVILGLKIFFLTCLEQESTHSPKILLSVLKYVPVDETEEVMLRLCKTYVECAQDRASLGVVQLLRQQRKRQQEFILEFMTQNFGYEGAVGRKRVVTYAAELVELCAEDTSAVTVKAATKLFFVAAHRLINEDLEEIRVLLGRIIKALARRQFEQKDINVSDSVNKWLSNIGNDDKIVLVIMAVKIGALVVDVDAAEATKFCGRVVTQIKGVFGDDTDEVTENKDALVMLRTSAVTILSGMIGRKEGGKVAREFLAERAEIMAGLLLHPNSHFRESVVRMITLILSACDSHPKQWVKWRSDDVLHQTEMNLLEILKLSAATSLDNLKEPLYLIGRLHAQHEDVPDDHHMSPFAKYLKKLITAFFHEKKEDPNSFIRRIPIVSLIKRFLVEGELFFPTEADLSPVVKLCTKHESVVDISEDIASMLKVMQDRYGMEAYSRMVQAASSFKEKLAAGEKRKLIHDKKQKKENPAKEMRAAKKAKRN